MQHAFSKFLTVVFFFFSQLFADEDIDRFSLLNATASPISKVFQGVNVITGDFVDNEYVEKTSGPDPYVVATSYCSSNLEMGSLSNGWDFYHPSSLECYMPKGLPFKPGKPKDLLKKDPDMRTKLYYRESGGGLVHFTGTKDGHKFKAKLKGVGYSIGGEGAGKASLYNVDIEHHSNADNFTVTLGDGTKRFYQVVDKPKHEPKPEDEEFYFREFHIVKEELPSGASRIYSYDSDDELKKVKTVGKDPKHVLNYVEFEEIDEDDQKKMVVTTSDKHKIIIPKTKVKSEEKDWKRVVRSIRPYGTEPVYFNYGSGTSKHIRRVEKKSRPSGAEQTLSYYGRDLKGRVKSLTTKVQNGVEEKIEFSYSLKERKTTIITPLALHKYYWDKEDRIVVIETTQLNNDLLQREEFEWSDKGLLTTRCLLDEATRVILKRTYKYDDNNNLITEKLHGNWTGREAPIKIKDKNSFHDTYTISRTYSKDGLNLLTKEIDSDGLFTEYVYKKNSNLLKAKYEGKDNKILKRTFLEYTDVVATCIQTDDGSARDREKTTGVTFCTIKRITPRMVLPHFGEPEAEMEYSLVNGKELLIKGARYKRNSRGLIVLQKDIGSDGSVLATKQFGYDNFDRIIYSIDALGTRTSLDYDSLGRVVEKRGPLPNHSINYRYDLLNRVIEETETWPEHKKFRTSKEYDIYGRVTKVTDFRGRTARTEYDALGRPVKVTEPETQAGTPVTTYKYTCLNQTATNAVGEITTISRNIFGSPVWVRKPDKSTTYYRYNSQGKVIEEILPSKLVTKTYYDAFSRPTTIQQFSGTQLLSETTKRYSAFFLLEEKAPSGLITKLTYDNLGRKSALKLISPDSTRETRFTYDNANRVSSELHPDLTQTLYQYDTLNRVVDTKRVGSTLLSHTQNFYDVLDRVTQQSVLTDQGMATTSTKYLPNGLPTSITNPLGDTTTFEYKFDKFLVKKTRDPRGVVVRELLDSADKLIQVKVFDRMGSLIADKSVRYDLSHRPVRFEEIAVGGSNETIFTEQSYYEGNLVKLILAKGTPDEATSIYEYNHLGQKSSESKPSGIKLLFSYDAKGRLLEQTSSDRSIAYRFSYDTSDRCVEAQDLLTGKSVTKTYNAFSEQTSENLEGLTLSSTYNSFGALATQTLPDNSTINYNYLDGRLSSIQRNDYQATVLSRSLNGRITSLALPYSAGIVNYSYDVLGRGTAISHPAFYENRTSFDPVGNLLERNLNGTPELFTYDDLNQLLSEPNANYRYDSLNRRLEKSGQVCQNNARYQLLNNGSETFSYDIDGRRLSQGSTNYSYDALDRLTAVETDTTRCTFGYDAFHRRLWKKVSDLAGTELSFEQFLFVGENEIGSYQNGIKELRILGEGLGAELGASVAFELNNQVVIPLHDLSGSVTTLLDTAGNILERYSYNAFGECTPTSASPLSPWRFASKRVDSETNMQFFGRRYYDATNGVWLTQDPLGIQAGPNLYAYVKNNPLTLFDLYGLAEQSERGFFGRCVDWICDLGRSVLSGIENVVFNLPHVGDCNRDTSDFINGYLGEPKREPRDPHMATATRRSVDESLSACNKAGQTSLPVVFGGMLNNTTDTIHETQHCFFLAEEEGYNVEDWFALPLGSDGFSMDLFRANMMCEGFPTSDVKNATPVLQNFLNTASQSNPGATVHLMGWSKGGPAALLLAERVTCPSNIKLVTWTIGSPKFNKDGPFNYAGKGDRVTTLKLSNQRFLRDNPSCVKVVGSGNKPFLQIHSFTSETYREALLDFYSRTLNKKNP